MAFQLPPWMSGNGTPYSNADTLMGVGLGLLGGKNAQEQVAGAAINFSNDRQMGKMVNKTVAFLEKSYPDLAEAVKAGNLSAGDAWKMAYSQKLEAEKPKNDFMAVGGSLYNKGTGEWITPPAGPEGAPEFGLQPVWGEVGGKPALGQISKDGTFKQLDLPEGFQLSTGTGTVDLGTQIGTVDKRTGQVISTTPKDIAGAEREKGVGKAQGEAVVGLPAAIQGADYGIKLIDEMIAHPGRETATGASSTWDPRNYAPGTDATDFQVRARQVEGRAFLEAFDALKGGGAITEIEGQKATQAAARLDRAQSDEEYLTALKELRTLLEVGKQRALQRAGGGAPVAPAAPAPAQAAAPANPGGTTGGGLKWRVK
ncbi:hypothetical protein CN204_04200 [Sinorhizobium meliloti]|uniref:hypothetical protein n=1 Tax=Rhizobium meliloti TaxID=382 RepID=UPI000FDA52AE|nr:hypothetical protein [Sinorhizobium meliloti]RVH87739.1 hypothetical protein CN204_04200 [Sinorhizobium meliloti]